MERKIYFNTQFVILSDGKNTKFLGETYICTSKSEILHIITEYITNPHTDICIVFPKFEYLWEIFSKQFRSITAAGGVVSNKSNEILCIYRNGMWDLPKGKAEKGETTEQTAVREVCEETGLQSVVCTWFLCSTWHTYQHPKGTVLKQTYWYTMHTEFEQTLLPQIEEGITDIAWVSHKDIDMIKKQTYSSICDVLDCLE